MNTKTIVWVVVGVIVGIIIGLLVYQPIASKIGLNASAPLTKCVVSHGFAPRLFGNLQSFGHTGIQCASQSPTQP
ncbi:MAG TPA: hypothetical protein VLE93_01470 [Candidatus Saccharimonadales bacterium]|nr:hypothetical protein [Candidatus Saccharimonadales bacterium]